MKSSLSDKFVVCGISGYLCVPESTTYPKTYTHTWLTSLRVAGSEGVAENTSLHSLLTIEVPLSKVFAGIMQEYFEAVRVISPQEELKTRVKNQFPSDSIRFHFPSGFGTLESGPLESGHSLPPCVGEFWSGSSFLAHRDSTENS